MGTESIPADLVPGSNSSSPIMVQQGASFVHKTSEFISRGLKILDREEIPHIVQVVGTPSMKAMLHR
jgi:hypothetical protein